GARDLHVAIAFLARPFSSPFSLAFLARVSRSRFSLAFLARRPRSPFSLAVPARLSSFPLTASSTKQRKRNRIQVLLLLLLRSPFPLVNDRLPGSPRPAPPCPTRIPWSGSPSAGRHHRS